MKSILLTIIFLLLTSCAYRPLVDPKGVNPTQYQADLEECQELANQISPVKSISAGTIVGGIFGALLGLAVGVTGSGEGYFGTTQGQAQAIQNCLTGRGYRVLR